METEWEVDRLTENGWQNVYRHLTSYKLAEQAAIGLMSTSPLGSLLICKACRVVEVKRTVVFEIP